MNALDLHCKLWSEINSEMELLEAKIPEFGELRKPVPTDKKHVKRYYKFSEATSLEIGEEDGFIWFGVGCDEKQHVDSYAMLETGLNHLVGEKSASHPWYRWVDKNLNLSNPTSKNLKWLPNTKKRKEFVKKIVKDVEELLEALEDIALVNAMKEGEETGFVSEEEIFKILREGS